MATRKPRECIGCPLHSSGRGFVKPSGKGFSGVSVIGDIPSEAEIKSGIPFHFEGKTGLIFRKILAKGGIDAESLRICNVLQCIPPLNNPYTPEARAAISHCKVHRDVALKDSKSIVALGDLPFELLAGETGVEDKRGYQFHSIEYGCPVIPSIHPSFINFKRATNLIPAVLYDLKIAPMRDRGECRMSGIEDPPLDWFEDYCEDAKENASWLVVDIETPYSSTKGNEEDLDDDPSSQIIRASIAFDTERAVSFPWTPLYVDILDPLLRGGMDKVFWNANFDVPRLEYNGMVLGGRIVDAMWLWHFLQPDLPRGLGHVATYYTDLPEWKSKSSSAPAYYSCCDAYATANVYVGVMRHLKERGMLDLAERDVTDLLQILQKMRRRGILVDREALERFKVFLTKKLSAFQAEMNEKVPPSIRKYHPANGFVRTPLNTDGMVQITKEMEVKEKCPTCGNSKKNGKATCATCAGKGKVEVRKEVTRWAVLKDFSPNSSSQVKEYMRAMKHPVPYSKKESKETTDKRFLQRYAALYPSALYLPILEYRKTAKLLGTYTAWPIGEDGRIHTRFSLAPATGRLSSLNPNVQNIPSEGEMADMFRDCLIADPGKLIIRRDYTGAEAFLTGYFANDPLFMKLSTMGVYTYVLAKHIGLQLDPNDPSLPEILAKIKKENKEPKPGEYVSPYKKFKTLVLGICYGLGPDQMFEQNPGVFSSKGEARKLRKFFFQLFPKIEMFQENAVEEARTTALVKNPFGYIRWLWDVPGLDGPKAIAQKPQSSLAAIIKRAMRGIDESPIADDLFLQIHDELAIQAPENDWEWRDEVLKEIMERPIPELGGLVIRTERKMGRSMRG
jgi:uracil-DNA glycosylase family 4